MSSPIRLRIVYMLCRQELYVTQLLERVPATKPDMLQHLSALCRAGVLTRRREGIQTYYRIDTEYAAAIYRTICADVASADSPSGPACEAADDGE